MAVPEMTLCVVSRQGAVFWQFDFQAASMDAASISKIGIPSCIGYTRRHSPHFKLGGFSFRMSGFLQAGQTRMSSRSGGIMMIDFSADGANKHRR